MRAFQLQQDNWKLDFFFLSCALGSSIIELSGILMDNCDGNAGGIIIIIRMIISISCS